MAFALCPDNGLPRLWRPVPAGSLGYGNGGRPIVSVLLKEKNTQLIDHELLETLPELQRVMVLRTHAAFEYA